MLPSSARSMVIRDLDPTRSLCRPDKTDPVLIVDPDAMLPRAVLAECFQVIARGYPKRPERNGGVQLVELAFCGASQLLGARSARRLGAAPVEDVLRSLIMERANHGPRPASLNEDYNGYRYTCQADLANPARERFEPATSHEFMVPMVVPNISSPTVAGSRTCHRAPLKHNGQRWCARTLPHGCTLCTPELRYRNPITPCDNTRGGSSQRRCGSVRRPGPSAPPPPRSGGAGLWLGHDRRAWTARIPAEPGNTLPGASSIGSERVSAVHELSRRG